MIDYIQFYFITAVLAIHFIADFIFQTDGMAKGKSKSNDRLTDHVVVYTTISGILYSIFVFPMIFPDFWNTGLFGSDAIFGIFMVYLGVTHWITDYVTSRINAKLYTKDIHLFFVGVGGDQLFHYLTIFGFFAAL